VTNRHLFACLPSDRALPDDHVRSLQKLAHHHGAALVIIGSLASARPDVPVLRVDELLDRLGGPVSGLLPLEPGYPEVLTILGQNTLPPGVAGKPMRFSRNTCMLAFSLFSRTEWFATAKKETCPA
jgi:hypothetical protein